MIGKSLILDTMLLVLFTVGSTDRNLVTKHKRLKEFSVDDFDLLYEMIRTSSQVFVTPNTLTETSNWLAYIDEPARTKVFKTFRAIIRLTQEEYVESRDACTAREFPRIGLTDVALLNITDESRMLVTCDLDLYLSALSRGLTAINFNHYRQF